MRIALFGGSFNPPGLHHRAIAEALAREFDEVRVIPCGPRLDKLIAGNIPPLYRAALADLAFADLPRAEVDLSDLERAAFTPNIDLQARHQHEGELWHVVGADLIRGGRGGESPIQLTWHRGGELWQSANFAVISRPGYALDPGDLPPRARIIDLHEISSSTLIRDRLSHGDSVRHLVPARVCEYLRRYGLYRAPIPGVWARGTLAEEPFLLLTDLRNPTARDLAARLPAGGDASAARFVTVLGGDGAMLRAIREHWRRRQPFFGINAGHIGFLMNSPDEALTCDFPPRDVIFRQLPMLYLEFEDSAGQIRTEHGFNDAWLERATSQSAWLQITVNSVPRIEKLVSDGALVATAAGSTAYARSMGASPLPADTPAWLLVGSNVMEPSHWRSALLPIDATVEIRNLSPERRPICAYVDGEDIGEVVAMRARISRAAGAELIFCSSHDMAEKIANIQFQGTA